MDNGHTYGIVRTPGIRGGKPRIDGTRMCVQDIAIAREREHMTIAQIQENYTSITLAQIHAALAYYYDNKAEIEAEIEAGLKFAEDFRQQHPEWCR